MIRMCYTVPGVNMMVKIGDIIRDVRKRKGFTQTTLAEKVGISLMSIRRYENGERIIPEKILHRINDELGEDVVEIYLSERKKEDDEIAKIIFDAHSITKAREFEELTPEEISQLLAVAEKYNIVKPIPKEERLLNAFNCLNEDGQDVAIERVEELTQIPKYQRTSPTEPPETPLDDGKGNSTVK